MTHKKYMLQLNTYLYTVIKQNESSNEKIQYEKNNI